MDISSISLQLITLFGAKAKAELLAKFGEAGNRVREIIVRKAGEFLWEKIRGIDDPNDASVGDELEETLTVKDLNSIQECMRQIRAENPETTQKLWNATLERYEGKELHVEGFGVVGFNAKDSKIDVARFTAGEDGSKKKQT